MKDAKAVGFIKSGLAQSIYAELKAHRINKPAVQATPPKLPKAPTPGRKPAA